MFDRRFDFWHKHVFPLGLREIRSVRYTMDMTKIVRKYDGLRHSPYHARSVPRQLHLVALFNRPDPHDGSTRQQPQGASFAVQQQAMLATERFAIAALDFFHDQGNKPSMKDINDICDQLRFWLVVEMGDLEENASSPQDNPPPEEASTQSNGDPLAVLSRGE